MKTTAALKSLGVAAACGLVATTLPAASHATPLQGAQASAEQADSAIVTTPAKVRLTAKKKQVVVKVTYQCTNTAEYTHYLSGNVAQPRGEETQYYVFGYRNDTGGIQAATCTGEAVTEKLRFKQDSFTRDVYPNRTLKPGKADLTFSVERRNADGNGPGWYELVDTQQVTHQVKVVKQS